MEQRLNIVTDTTCVLPDAFFEQYPIVRVPTWVHFGEQGFREIVDISTEDLFARVEQTRMIPKTSQPTPAQFVEVYQSLPPDVPILSIHLSSFLSGTFRSAELAAAECPDRHILLFDSRAFHFGLGFMVWDALEQAAQGAALDAIMARLMWRREHTFLALTPKTLDYLRLSGRVSMLQHALGAMLNVKPIISLKDGRLIADGRTRTRKRALAEIVERVARAVTPEDRAVWVGIAHAGVPEEAAWLKEQIEARVNAVRCVVGGLTPAVAVHGGPGVIGAFLTPAEPAPEELEVVMGGANERRTGLAL